jgi:hypothetical protein
LAEYVTLRYWDRLPEAKRSWRWKRVQFDATRAATRTYVDLQLAVAEDGLLLAKDGVHERGRKVAREHLLVGFEAAFVLI